MELIIDLLVQFLIELCIPVILELITDYGWHSHTKSQAIKEPRPFKRWQLILSYTGLGILLGFITLLILPHSLLPTLELRLLNLLLTPIVCGVTMAAIGRWRVKNGKPRTAMEHFIYAYLLALGIAAVRCYIGQAEP